MIHRRAAFSLAALPMLAAWAPDRPVRILVGFAAGGGTDIVARLMAEQGVEPDPGTPAQFAAFLAREATKLGEIIRAANITLEG